MNLEPWQACLPSKRIKMFWNQILLWSSSLLLFEKCFAQIQNPVISCSDNKRKILCLPIDYSKFDLPYRNEYNVIDIGESALFPFLYLIIKIYLKRMELGESKVSCRWVGVPFHIYKVLFKPFEYTKYFIIFL